MISDLVEIAFLLADQSVRRRMNLLRHSNIYTNHDDDDDVVDADDSHFTGDKLSSKMLQPNQFCILALHLWAFGIDTHFCGSVSFNSIQQRCEKIYMSIQCCKLILDETLPLRSINKKNNHTCFHPSSIEDWCVVLLFCERVCKCYCYLTNQPLGHFTQSIFIQQIEIFKLAWLHTIRIGICVMRWYQPTERGR